MIKKQEPLSVYVIASGFIIIGWVNKVTLTAGGTVGEKVKILSGWH